MSNKKLVVIGSLGSARDIIEAAELLGYEIIKVNPTTPSEAVLDMSNIAHDVLSLPVILGSFLFDFNDELRFDARTIQNRISLMNAASQAGFWNWTTIVHPSAVVSPSSTIGMNVFIGPNSTISYNSQIADNVFVNRNVSIGHNVEIGKYSRIGPGTTIPGHVRLRERVTTGPGVVMINNLIIEADVAIAAGAVVTKDIAPGLLVFGSPASAQRPFRIRISKGVKKSLKKILVRAGLIKVARELKSRIGPTRPHV